MKTGDAVLIERPLAFAGETGKIVWTDGQNFEVKFDRIATAAVFHISELRPI
jgi:hypothetical protein